MLKREDAWKMLVDDMFGRFVKYLYEVCHFEIDDICYMIEKPWKYFPEWNEFLDWHEKENE